MYRYKTITRLFTFLFAVSLILQSPINTLANLNKPSLISKNIFLAANTGMHNPATEAELRLSLICSIIEGRAAGTGSVNEIYLDDILLWEYSSDWVFENTIFHFSQGEIIISLPDSSIIIRYFNPYKAKHLRGKHIGSVHFINKHLARQIINLSDKKELEKLRAKQHLPENIIDPKDIPTGKKLEETIDRVFYCTEAKGEDYPLYNQLVVTGYEILTAYIPFLNREGFRIRRQFEKLYKRLMVASIDWGSENFDEFKKLIIHTPTIKYPNEELFVDVFPGFTREQLMVLVFCGYEHELSLHITKGCGNQCSICGVSKGKGKMVHMPFPIIVKILKKMGGYVEEGLMPYFRNDPMYYHDEVINATIADIIKTAKAIGYPRVTCITHGVGGQKAETVGNIVKDIDRHNSFAISFHIYHEPAVSYAREKFKHRGEDEPKELLKRRKKLKRMYSNRFFPLIKSALGADKKFTIRYYTPYPSIEGYLEQYPLASFVINEIQTLQIEIWRDIVHRIREETGKNIDDETTYRDDTNVTWVNDAAKLLRDLGVSNDTIEKVQRFHISILGNIQFFINTEADGVIRLITAETGVAVFRTVGEMFDRPNSQEFATLIDLLRICAKVDFGSPAIDWPIRNVLYSQISFDELSPAIQHILLENIKKSPSGERYGSEKDLRDDIAGIAVGPDSFKFIEAIFAFFMSQDELEELLNSPETKDNPEAIYNRLKNIPLPNSFVLGLKMRDSGIATCISRFYYLPHDHPVFRRDIFTSFREFVLPARAFTVNNPDINLAYSTKPLPHHIVNDYIRKKIPYALSDANFDNRIRKLKKYPFAENYGVRARIIPIQGLLKETGQFGHIGLGQIYGEPVVYIDSDYTDDETVINHELFEISKWEAKRKTLIVTQDSIDSLETFLSYETACNRLSKAHAGRILRLFKSNIGSTFTPQMMRWWIRVNIDEAKRLAGKWHRAAPKLEAGEPAESSLPKNIIDPDDISTGQILVDFIHKITSIKDPAENDYELYNRLVVTGHEILTSYASYLNKSGLKIREAFKGMRQSLQNGRLKWNRVSFANLQRLSRKIPTVNNPNVDLFIDVFPNLTEEDLSILQKTQYFLATVIQLSAHCGNQCAICGASKTRGHTEHIPFPVIAKIIINLPASFPSLVPYFASDPMHYRDKTINATINDVIDYADTRGSTRTTFATHGAGGTLSQTVHKIAKGSKGKFDISFHLYDQVVINYLISEWEREQEGHPRDPETRKTIIKKYTERFSSLIEGGLDSGQLFKIRFLSGGPAAKRILHNYIPARNIIEEIQNMQNEVWKKIKERILESKGIDIDTKKDSQIITWVNDAARLLQRIGVPENDIRTIQEREKGYNIFAGSTQYFSIIMSDGTVKLLLVESDPKGNPLFRTAGEMFDGPFSDEFRIFLDFLKICVHTDHDPYAQSEWGSLSDIQLKKLDRRTQLTIKQMLKPYYGKYKHCFSSLEELIDCIEYIKLFNETRNFFDVIYSIFLSREGFKELLGGLDGRENLQKAYDRLKNIPFPTKIPLSVMLKAKSFTPLYIRDGYKFIADDHPAARRDTFNSFRTFEFPFRAYTVNDDINLGGIPEEFPEHELAEGVTGLASINKPLISAFLNNNKPFLLRIPVDMLDDRNIELLRIIQASESGYVELYSTDESEDDPYKKHRLRKKQLPDGFISARENTITLIPFTEDEEICVSGLFAKLKTNPAATIISPFKSENDPTGFLRSLIFGFRIMFIARQSDASGRIDQVFVENTIEQFRKVYKSLGIDDYNLINSDLIDIATGDINKLLKALRKLIKLLPSKPILPDTLDQIHEHTRNVLTSA